MEPDIIKNQFIQLYNDESDSIFRFCLLRTSDREVAADIVQDTFMSFWDTLSHGEQKIQNERAFLFTIARNRIIDWYRKKKSLSLDSIIEGPGVEAETFMLTSPERREDIEMVHEGKFLLEKIQKLDPPYQQAVYLRYVEDLKPKEIAEIVREPANVVSVRIFRGLQQLKKLAKI